MSRPQRLSAKLVGIQVFALVVALASIGVDAARIVAARGQRGGDQRRRKPADADLPARVSRAGSRPWRTGIRDRPAHRARDRRFRPRGGHAAPRRSGAPAVRPRHHRHRRGFRRVRPRLGDAQAQARAHRRGQRARRGARGVRALRRRRQPPGRDAGARHRPDDRPCCAASSSRSWRSRSPAPSR